MPVDSGGRWRSFAFRQIGIFFSLLVIISSRAAIALNVTVDNKTSKSSGEETATNKIIILPPILNETLIFESSIDRIYYQPSSMIDLQQDQLNSFRQQQLPNYNGDSNSQFTMTPSVASKMRQTSSAMGRSPRSQLISYSRRPPGNSFYTLTEATPHRAPYNMAASFAPQSQPMYNFRGPGEQQTAFVGLDAFVDEEKQPAYPTAQQALLQARLKMLQQQAGGWQQLVEPQHKYAAATFAASDDQRQPVGAAWSDQLPPPPQTQFHQFHQNVQMSQVPPPPPPRPKIAVNLSSLLQPGQVLLSQQVNAQPRPNVSVVNMSEFQGLIQKLKPLALSSHEKATSVKNSLNLSSDAIAELDAADEQPLEEQQQDDREDEAEMLSDGDHEATAAALKALRERNRLDRILPTSHLFGGSVGLVNDNKAPRVGVSRRGRKPSVLAVDGDHRQAQQTAFLDTLAALGAKLSDNNGGDQPLSQEDAEDQEDEREDQEDNREFAGAASPSSTQAGHFQRPAASARPNSIPIELLVDHLMAGSRQATRGRLRAPNAHFVADQAGGGGEEPNGGNQPLDYNDDDEMGEDYEDYDEEDPSSALPIPEEPQQGLESLRHEVKVKPTAGGTIAKPISFNSVANKSDSWIPLTKLGGALGSSFANDKRPVVRKSAEFVAEQREPRDEFESSSGEGDTLAPPEAENRKPKRRKRPKHHGKKKKKKSKKRKRRRARKSMDEESGLVIGNKKLSRAELMRLISLLNKTASSKRPSREREAARKLLRLLIKMAIDNYKRGQRELAGSDVNKQEEPAEEDDGGGDDSTRGARDERLRDSLRSLLMEPEVGNAPDANNNNNNSRISIQLQPWRVKSVLSFERPVAASETTGDGETNATDSERPKSLVQISDDLERYFDTDFFDDLADKNATESGDTQTDGNPTSPSATAGKSSAPAPIVINRQKLEEADEDDVDLDHVRVVKLTGGRKRLSGKTMTKHKMNGRRKKKRPRGDSRKGAESRTTSYKNRRRATAPAGRDEDEDEKEDADEADEDSRGGKGKSVGGRKTKGVKKVAVGRKRKRRRGRRKRPQARGGSNQTIAAGDEPESKQAKATEQQKVADGQPAEENEEQQGEEEEEDDEEPAGQEGDSGNLPGSNKDKAKIGERRRRRRKQNARHPERDEIPAPILAARMSATTTGELAKHEHKPISEANKPKSLLPATVDKLQKKEVAHKKSQTEQKKSAAKGQQKVRADSSKSTNNKTNTTPNTTKVVVSSKKAKPETTDKPAASTETQPDKGVKPKRALGEGRARSRGARSGGGGHGVGGDEGRDEESWTNEGTQVCEDGKCRSILRSSHPGVNRHVEGNPDRKSLVKQIDRWLTDEEESDRRDDTAAAAS